MQTSTPQLANFFAYILALTVSYFGQRYWTFFKIKSKNSFNAILRFICVSFLGYALNAVWVYT
ncbi:MAG: putative flippase GtrA, partial [Glaciecola sp.]|jgi:putative flippase GtrA